MSFATCQTKIKGKVTDENSVPIAFASVGIENTPIGTICNTEGIFELLIPEGVEEPIIISHLGYDRQIIKPSQDFISIFLQETITQLKEVKVTTLTARGMMELAISLIGENYEFEPVTYTIYTSNKEFRKKEPAFLIESIVDMYRNDQKISYDIIKLRGKPTAKMFKQEFDEARTIWIMGHKWQLIEQQSRWSLKKSDLKLYSYAYDSITILNNRLVQVINAKPTEKGLKKDKDEFTYFIDLENYAIVKCHEYGSWEYDVEYQLFNGKWHLKSFYKHAKALYKKPDKSFINQTVVLDITEGQPDGFEPLGYRIVQPVKHEIQDWNDSFWENYSFIKLEDYWTTSE